MIERSMSKSLPVCRREGINRRSFAFLFFPLFCLVFTVMAAAIGHAEECITGVSEINCNECRQPALGEVSGLDLL